MTPSGVVARVRAVEYIAVGQDRWRRGGLVEDVPVSGPVRCRIEPKVHTHDHGAEPACAFGRGCGCCDRNRYAAAIFEYVAHRRVPLPCQVRIHGYYPSIPGAVVDA